MRRAFRLAVAGLALCTQAHFLALGQITADEGKAVVGDAPADPGPLANDLSGEIVPGSIQAAMRKVADWQAARVEDSPSQDWTFATLYIGMLSASETLHDPRYRTIVSGVAGSLSLDAWAAEGACRRSGNRAGVSVAVSTEARALANRANAETV